MTVKRNNGANESPNTITSLVAMMQSPTANSLLMSQRFALEAARFWARRMHAYADQMETLAACTSADQLARAQTRFIDRMREDYTAETKALSDLMSPPREPPRRRRANGEHAQS